MFSTLRQFVIIFNSILERVGACCKFVGEYFTALILKGNRKLNLAQKCVLAIKSEVNESLRVCLIVLTHVIEGWELFVCKFKIFYFKSW